MTKKVEREKLLMFAVFVLATLENNEDWNSDVFNTISEKAFELGLASTDADGFFLTRETFNKE